MQDLITRGLTRPLLFVTDDFSGLKEVVKKLFPYTDHQLCYIHLQRNLHHHLSKSLYAAIKKKLYLARKAETKEEGLRYFEEVCTDVAREKKDLAERLKERAGNYLAFLSYPEAARKHLYTTNIVESINAGLEEMRYRMGGHFPSMDALDSNYFVQIENRNARWMRRGIVDLEQCLYEIRQLYALRFEVKEEAQA